MNVVMADWPVLPRRSGAEGDGMPIPVTRSPGSVPYGRGMRRFCVTRLTRCLISTHTGDASETPSGSP